MISKQTRHNWRKRFCLKIKDSAKLYGKKDRRLNKVNQKIGDNYE